GFSPCEDVCARGLASRILPGKGGRLKDDSCFCGPQECAARKTRRTRSTTTEEIVRKQCATVRINGKPGMNAQDDTLQNVTGLRFRFGRTFCGAQGVFGNDKWATRASRQQHQHVKKPHSG